MPPNFKALARGYSLPELLIVLFIISIISVIGLANFTGSISFSQAESAKNQLRLISLAQAEFSSEFGKFYCPSDSAPHNAVINTNLFSGKELIAETSATHSFEIFCSTNEDNYYVKATSMKDSTSFECLNELNKAVCNL